ncbi:hypothetical protein AAG570_009993 [Ranatra chinensis]|uniref:Uncharacterized protein n=1 Tax=Ranatra chinensis TaxID=642074 RepID=A0ABD0YQQ1_9HEMI
MPVGGKDASLQQSVKSVRYKMDVNGVQVLKGLNLRAGGVYSILVYKSGERLWGKPATQMERRPAWDHTGPLVRISGNRRAYLHWSEHGNWPFPPESNEVPLIGGRLLPCYKWASPPQNIDVGPFLNNLLRLLFILCFSCMKIFVTSNIAIENTEEDSLSSKPVRDNGSAAKMFTVTQPNGVHMLWQLPQYLILTTAEIFYSIANKVFIYSQSPPRMRALTGALWVLANAFGDILVAVLVHSHSFKRQRDLMPVCIMPLWQSAPTRPQPLTQFLGN